MSLVKNKIGIYGNVWFNCFVLNKGEEIPCHSHEHQHVTLIGHGSVEAMIDGKPAGMFVKGEACPVDKNTMHGYKALEDNTTLFCTFAVRKTGEVDPASWEDMLRLPSHAPRHAADIHPNFFKEEKET